MIRPLLLVLLLIVGVAPVNAAESVWEKSVVTVEVTFKDYDFFQPWNTPTRSVRKHGLYVGNREVVTTAQYLPTETLVRLQKGGRGKWYAAKVVWFDPHADLAVITSDDPEFWVGLRPARLAKAIPQAQDFNLIRWRDGNLESRRVEFSKFAVKDGSLSFAPRLTLELNTDLGGLGWAEPVTLDGAVAGLTTSKSGNTCNVVPAPFIRQILEARAKGRYPGMGYFDFVWEPGENPTTLEHLKLKGPGRGAIVIRVPDRPGVEPVLKPRDILLEVDGFPIDVAGDYLDPQYGHLLLENLSSRGHLAGDTVRMKVWRDGAETNISYVLPKAQYHDDLVPRELFDHPPEYVVAGGLVFQALDQPFLRGWGEDWRRRAPFRLQHYQNSAPTPERPSLVLLSTVLPDPVNVGYQDARLLVVDRINGHRISTLADVVEALKDPKDGVHRVEFMKGDTLQSLLLDAASMDQATQRVIRRYGLPAAQRITGPTAQQKAQGTKSGA
jgi:S1-C subfamily serine protease